MFRRSRKIKLIEEAADGKEVIEIAGSLFYY